MLRYIYIAFGILSLSIGMLGIFTPGLPTTPFILLTSYLFARSSPRLYKKLKENKVTGFYLNKINSPQSLKYCFISVALMWVMVSITTFAVFEDGKMRVIMLSAGIVGTIAQVILFYRKRAKALLLIDTIGKEPNTEDELD